MSIRERCGVQRRRRGGEGLLLRRRSLGCVEIGYSWRMIAQMFAGEEAAVQGHGAQRRASKWIEGESKRGLRHCLPPGIRPSTVASLWLVRVLSKAWGSEWGRRTRDTSRGMSRKSAHPRQSPWPCDCLGLYFVPYFCFMEIVARFTKRLNQTA
jgi:hypothetical protein